MIEAINEGNVDVVAQILGAGNDPDADLGGGYTALHRAAARNQSEIVDALLAAGAALELRADGYTPLMFAAIHGDARMVTALLEAGADPHAPFMPFFGARPIHLSAEFGNVDALDAFLAWGIDLEIMDNDGGSPLLCAGYGGQMSTTQHLIALGADLTVRDNSGFTARGLAEQGGHAEVAQAIADAGGTL